MIIHIFPSYGWNIEWHMSLGDKKCPIIKDIISRNLKQQKDPKRRVKLLECGSYSGYSTVLFGQALPEDGLIISTEIDNEFSAISKKLYDLSKLQEMIFHSILVKWPGLVSLPFTVTMRHFLNL